MRIVVLILLLANIGFFGWSHLQGARAQVVAPQPQIPSLQLATARQAPTTQCHSIGPFAEDTQVQSVAAALTARGIGSLARTLERQVPNGQWVYIEGFNSATDRQRALQKLKHAGLKDVAEMSEPQYSGRISAGIFFDPKGAQSRAVRVRDAGFQPVIEDRLRTVSERWLDVELNVGIEPMSPAELGVAGSTAATITWSDCAPQASGG